MPRPSSFSTFTYGGIAGLSLVSLFAIFKLWKHWHILVPRHALVSKDLEITALQQLLDAARADAHVQEGTLGTLREEVDSMKGQLDVVDRLVQGLRDQNQTLGERIISKEEELEVFKDETRVLKEQYAQTITLLDTRTKELRGAEAFLTKADSISGADVIAMLNALNSEIYQTAALVAESFQFQPRTQANGKAASLSPDDENEPDMSEVYQSGTDILGSRMVDLLKSAAHHEDPTLVQIAFQAGMSAYSNWIISAWDFEDPDDERLLGEIYGRLKLGEEQTISGRWRALTRAYVRQNDQEHLAMYFIDAFVNILLIAGAHQSHKELHDFIASRFTDRINIIVKSAQGLRKAIGEDVTSCDFEIIFIPQDRPFDPSKMDDTFASGLEKSRATPETVLCTTDLGLSRSFKVGGKGGELEQTILLRPKIALQSGIDEMIMAQHIAYTSH